MTTKTTHKISIKSVEGNAAPRYFSDDRTDRRSLKYEVKTYAGLPEESVAKIEVFEMIGEVNEDGTRGRFYNPTYGYTITSDRHNGYRATGLGDLGEATVKAFARAAAAGNGGFPLDWNVDYRKPRRAE